MLPTPSPVLRITATLRIFCLCVYFFGVFCFGLFGQLLHAQSPEPPPYSLNVAVDEVSLTFHAADARGFPVTDLTLDDLQLLDNGKPPQKILAFQSTQELPVRAGILVDTSVSMDEDRSGNLPIWTRYAQHLLLTPADQAFLMDFDFLSKVAVPWTNDGTLLARSVGRVNADGRSRIGGTAIFDAIYRACQNQFGKLEPGMSGNFILLFSDGQDNASHAYLKEAVAMCQKSNTAIYAFRMQSGSSFSSGPKTLAELADETGGRVFSEDSEAGIANHLRAIEANLRIQYRLIYRPLALKHDGAFHRIQLKLPERVDSLTIRSGYYAPGRP